MAPAAVRLMHGVRSRSWGGTEVWGKAAFFFLFPCVLFSLLWCIPPACPQENADTASAYVSDLLRRGAAANLANHRYWHLLLHYRPNRLHSGYTSAIEDPQFFLSPLGKTDPQAELAATLTTLFSPAR